MRIIAGRVLAIADSEVTHIGSFVRWERQRDSLPLARRGELSVEDFRFDHALHHSALFLTGLVDQGIQTPTARHYPGPAIQGRVTTHNKCPAHRVAFLCCRASPLNDDLSGEDSARSHE